MTRHLYKVGQVVDYVPGRLGMPPTTQGFTIMSLLPYEGGDLLYRIKSAGERFERVAKERDLKLPTK